MTAPDETLPALDDPELDAALEAARNRGSVFRRQYNKYGQGDPATLVKAGCESYCLRNSRRRRKTKRVRLFTDFVSRRFAAYAPLLAGVSVSRD